MSMKMISRLKVKSAQSKLKRRLFATFIVVGGTTLVVSNLQSEAYLYFENNPFTAYVIKNCRELTKKEFKPTWYLPTAFLQGLYGSKIDPVPFLPFEREKLKLGDGGSVVLDWGPILKSDDKEDTRILFILHGLTGGSECNYIRHAVLEGEKNAYRTVAFNHRGIDNALETPEYHDLTDLSDIRTAIQYVHAKYPKAALYGMGISFGANMLVKYAGETEEKCEMKALVSIANPYDLQKCCDEISKPTKFIYHWSLLRNFKRNLKRNAEQLSKNPKINLDEVLKSRTIKEYDEKFNLRVGRYKTLEEYYTAASCINHIPRVKIPVLFINSLDDPVIDNSVIPYDKIKSKPNMILLTTQKGGHIDWFCSRWTKRWVYWPAIEFLNCIDSLEKESTV